MLPERLLRVGVLARPAAIDARVLEVAQALGTRLEPIEQRAERVGEADAQLGELVRLGLG